MQRPLRLTDCWRLLAALAVVLGTSAARGQSPFPTTPPTLGQTAPSAQWPPVIPSTPAPATNGTPPANSGAFPFALPSTAPPRPAAALPEPVYWSQQLFMIPYKWDSGTTASGASTVKLYLSQDQGATWKQISDAKPEVQFFNYHAPSDGEYIFSIQTIDTRGRAWPQGPPQPELRVIVDTQNPTITSFNAQLTADGTASAVWQASDAHLDSNRAVLEYRTPDMSAWQAVPGGSVRAPAVGFAQGEASWKVQAGTPSVWVRLTLRDLAGNGREAGAEARVGGSASTQLASNTHRLPPAPAMNASANPFPTGLPAASPTDPFGNTSPPASVGWAGGNTAQSAPTNLSFNTVAATPPPAIENWPSDGASPVPLGSPRSADVRRMAAPPVSFGMASTQTAPAPSAADSIASQPFQSPFQLPQASNNYPQMRTASAQPFGNVQLPSPSVNPLPNLPQLDGSTTANTPPAAPSAGAIQHLNSLEFEIGYDVDTAGTYGVTRVELWATRDAGQSWQRLSVDNDNRSPILAAVPAPGDYGLKIVVETAGGIDPVRPRPGDQPEIFVRVDTTPPVARLTGIQQGTGAEADRLDVQWQPGDSLSTGETVTLQYSASATGPWVSAATNLPHTGRYSWRLARHLPASFYVRLEIRDPAGNTASDQTQVPIAVTLPTPSGRLGEVRPVQ